jgi:hypothetical protein
MLRRRTGAKNKSPRRVDNVVILTTDSAHQAVQALAVIHRGAVRAKPLSGERSGGSRQSASYIVVGRYAVGCAGGRRAGAEVERGKPSFYRGRCRRHTCAHRSGGQARQRQRAGRGAALPLLHLRAMAEPRRAAAGFHRAARGHAACRGGDADRSLRAGLRRLRAGRRHRQRKPALAGADRADSPWAGHRAAVRHQ